MFPVGTTVQGIRPPLVTVTMIALCVLVFFWQAGLPPGAMEAVVRHFGVIPAHFTQAPWWAFRGWLVPALTSLFLHGGFSHLLGNMIFLYTFGPGVENRLGHVRFALFYLLCGLAAAATQAWSDPLSTIPLIGASGAIAGVLGAYLILYPFARVIMLMPIFFLPFFFDVPVLLFLLFWFLQNFLMGTLGLIVQTPGGGVAWWAHIGGFAAGALLLPILLDRRYTGYQQPRYNQRPHRHRARRY